MGPAQLDDEGGGPSHKKHRIRELALTQMIEATAQARTVRALNAKTQPAAELMDLQPRDLVEFYRNPNNKDQPGWRGPAEIVSIYRINQAMLTCDGKVVCYRFAFLRFVE